MDTELIRKAPVQGTDTEEKIIKAYEYRPAKRYGIFYLVPSLALCATAVQSALHNEAGLIINHISLSPNMGKAFAWGSAFFFFMIACFGLVLLIKSFQTPRSVTFYDAKMIVPKSPMSSKLMTVRYEDIHTLNMATVAKMNQVVIHTSTEKVLISDMNFADKLLFIEMLHTLFYKVPQHDLEA